MNLAEANHVSFADAVARVAAGDGKPFAEVFAHGTLTVEMFTPQQVDTQTPHTRDEVYVVARGSGEFFHEGHRTQVGPGDFLFVPAGKVHRFENFSADLAVWVLFYGPEGGEIAG